MNEINYHDFSDTELVQRCQIELPDTEDAFEELVDRYKNYVYKIAYEKLSNQMDAEDAAQETFIRIYFGLKNFRQESEFKTWLIKIVTNVCLTVLLTRKRKFWKYHVSLDGDVDINTVYLSIFSKYEEKHFWDVIGSTLRKLVFIYRKVFILKYFKGLSFSEIGGKINSTIPAVKMKILRAKEQFIKKLKSFNDR
ncbi:MAG: RNA polymerase sigma factor [Ignavibacteria bacterium]|nr:RNA polymerase sigma factor [Ignavibacteria bacterium]